MADNLIVRDTDGVTVRANAVMLNATGLIAGEALDAVAPCFVHTDGKVYMCNRTAHKTADSSQPLYAGFTSQSVAINHPVTLYTKGTLMHLAKATMTKGDYLFVSDTNGRVTNSEQTVTVVATVDFGGSTVTTVKVPAAMPIAYAWNASDILITR